MDLYGRLRFGKGYLGETQRGFGCTLIFGLELQTERLRALMEYAKNALISSTRFKRSPYTRFTFLRSNLLCHHSSIDLRNLLVSSTKNN